MPAADAVDLKRFGVRRLKLAAARYDYEPLMEPLPFIATVAVEIKQQRSQRVLLVSLSSSVELLALKSPSGAHLVL